MAKHWHAEDRGRPVLAVIAATEVAAIQALRMCGGRGVKRVWSCECATGEASMRPLPGSGGERVPVCDECESPTEACDCAHARKGA